MKTIGAILKEHRERAKMNIGAFSELTKISPKILMALEADDFKKLPGDFYIRKYIKVYAHYLKLKEQALLEVYEHQTFESPHKKKNTINNQQKETKVLLTPTFFKVFAIVSVAVIIVSYLVFQVSAIFDEPLLEVTTPAQDLIITETYIEIRGKTEKEALVMINGKEIFTDSNGFFITTLDLAEGINLITISAKKKHSKESIIYREILVQ